MFNNEQIKKLEKLKNLIIVTGSDEYGLSLLREKFLLLVHPEKIVEISFLEEEVAHFCKLLGANSADYEFLWKEPSLSKKEMYRKNVQELEMERAEELSRENGFSEKEVEVYPLKKEKIRK